MLYGTIMLKEMHCSIFSVEQIFRIIFAVRAGVLVFHSLVGNVDWPPFDKAPLLSLNPSGLPIHFVEQAEIKLRLCGSLVGSLLVKLCCFA